MSPTLGRATAMACRLCARPRRLASWQAAAGPSSRAATAQSPGTTRLRSEADAAAGTQDSPPALAQSEPGPMTRRLEEATEEALLTGGASGRRAVQDAGFSDELKERLLRRIADAKSGEHHVMALAKSSLPSAAGEGTRHMASSRPWTGSEAPEDAVLRMLDDARKPLKADLRGKYQPPAVGARPRSSPAQSPRQRAASARDQALLYAEMGIKGSGGLSEEEREEMKREFRERFQPAARPMPVTASGLAALANERIENAIARGQFKDLPRGKEAERDPRADNPFIDTTEYLVNKMIKRQDIVPPWIEKQQELAKAARVFRERLRNDWKWHAARMMAAQGGSLLEQMRRAEAHAAAERAHNPRQRGPEQMSVPSNSTDHTVMVKLRQQKCAAGDQTEPEVVADRGPLPPPFRDPDWERAEGAYMKLSIDNLNSITRSYNLMAPEVAKKPYFSLQRELAACFADVAPLMANEIKQRAVGGAGRPLRPAAARQGGGFMDHLGGRDDVRIHLEAEEKAYGFREWWRDFWRTGWRRG
ncbi:hypothetical protein CDD83_10964 [Cordyceps sp. RAO-2017]|nr:hypothetical protein CDD83_10964 [Cordyceps sp. RAO-2017]